MNMKRTLKISSALIALLIAAALVLTACSGLGEKKAEAATLKLATTTSVNDSGLLDYLMPSLLEEENIKLDVLPKGSGAAIQDAKDGNADIIIAHSPAAEQAFVDEGFGTDKQQFMYNYFVIVGPKADPAKVKSAADAQAAFKAVNETFKSNKECVFISRDDESGTDTKEKDLWKTAGFDTAAFSADFYQKAGAGMAATLVMADEKGGYTLSDKATFLANQKEGKLTNLEILLEANDQLKNVYSVTLISKDKYPDLQHDAAKRFHDWLLKDSTQQKIAEYGKAEYSEALFFIG
jgi:tungstate transport system substrate-binding protein